MTYKQINLYFHNLKFDGEFILWYLFEHGYVYSKEKQDKTFTTLISKMNVWYSMDITTQLSNRGKRNYIRIFDSLKKLPFSVRKIAKSFNLPISKLEIDYEKERPIGYQLSKEEIEYIRNDVAIVAMALEIQFKQQLTKMTIGSDALSYFKKKLGKRWGNLFPIIPLDVDKDLRLAYKGGYSYINSKYVGLDIGAGNVYDVNSLYPSVMYDRLLPYGYPVQYNGQYKQDKNFPLYIQCFTCAFELKKEHLPTVQIKNNLSYNPTQYLTSSNNDRITLYMTNVDMEMFFEHYDVYMLEYEQGYKFRGVKGIFVNYIDWWMDIKNNSDGAIRELAKLMLNSLYGKFATNPDVTPNIPIFEDGKIVYRSGEQEEREPVYTPMACFITAYAREVTISSAQQLGDWFVYADTDSLHVRQGDYDISNYITIHSKIQGKWKHEARFTKARFVRPKRYIEEIDGIIHVKCAGMQEQTKEQVTWNNFKVGTVYDGQLKNKRIKGGVVLKKTEFKLR